MRVGKRKHPHNAKGAEKMAKRKGMEEMLVLSERMARTRIISEVSNYWGAVTCKWSSCAWCFRKRGHACNCPYKKKDPK